MIAVDLRHVGDKIRNVVVMRERVVRFGDANLRVGTRALLLANHERDHARQIGLKRQELQIEHQRQVIFEHRRYALRLLQRRHVGVVLFLGLLNAAFDVANRLAVFVDLYLILRSELALQRRQLQGHRVEDAFVLSQSRFPGGAIGAAAVAEELFKDRARVVLHRQRLRRAAPGNGVGVRTAQNPGARTRICRRIHRQLQRGDLRLFRELPREQLVHRHIRDHLDFVPAAACGSRQKRSRRARVNVVPVRAQAGQDEHLVAEGRQRLQNGRELEGGAFAFRRPVLHGHPVRDVEGLEPVRRPGGGARRRRQRREHGVEERQRHGRTQPAQHRSSRQRFRGEVIHGFSMSCCRNAQQRSRRERYNTEKQRNGTSTHYVFVRPVLSPFVSAALFLCVIPSPPSPPLPLPVSSHQKHRTLHNPENQR